MDQTHLHLLITHLPIFGSVLGGIVLTHALLVKSESIKIAAYDIFVISALGAGISYVTGEAAEETAEKIQGVAENMIEQHEDFAIYALISLVTLGVFSLIGYFLAVRKAGFSKIFALVVLFIALISFGLVAWTGYLGGQIRHTEISDSNVPVQGYGEEIEEDD